MNEEILKWYGKHINESGEYDVWIGDKDAFYRAAYNKGEESMRQQLAECKRERDELYQMGLAQAMTIKKLEEVFGDAALAKVGADKTGE